MKTNKLEILIKELDLIGEETTEFIELAKIRIEKRFIKSMDKVKK